MGTVYPGLHQPAQHPLHDETLAYEGYPPTADANLMAPDPSGMDFYGALSEANWTQWLSPQDSVFPASASMGVPNISPQEQQYQNYGFSPDTATQWDSPNTSMHSHTQSSPSTSSPNPAVSIGDLDSRRGSTSTPSDKQKRKRNATPSTTAKTTRRASSKKTTRPQVSSEKLKPRSRKTKPVVEPTQEPSPDTEEEREEAEEPDGPSRGVQERNRVASNKFRVKKREDAKRLRVDEEGMERANRDLSVTVSDLTLQVYELKMRLLQHTDCECHLIQNYIANEAHRYIQDLGSGKKMHMTPPLPPQNFFRS
ncbi:BZIP domain-containing protein [Fusarium acuminatum]|uniref:BZIP domain-containing protein n=1 Tax=Fusarium acuminatum TaxID=5515 RepID=A0ABZ2X1L3_9HYPO